MSHRSNGKPTQLGSTGFVDRKLDSKTGSGGSMDRKFWLCGQEAETVWAGSSGFVVRKLRQYGQEVLAVWTGSGGNWIGS